VAQTVRAALGITQPAQTGLPPSRDTGPGAALARAQALKQLGRLNDAAILDALRRNASNEATAMLAIKADVPFGVIERACALRSAKGMVSLAWKAGLAVQTAVALQVALAHLPLDMVLRAESDHSFPLSEEEMRWQLAFLDAPERGTRTWMPRRLNE
jgi:hypothetical protein